MLYWYFDHHSGICRGTRYRGQTIPIYTILGVIMSPKYPNVKVKLVGEDGNAFFILGRVAQAMRRSGISNEEIEKFQEEATSGDYDNLLAIVMGCVNVS